MATEITKSQEIRAKMEIFEPINFVSEGGNFLLYINFS